MNRSRPKAVSLKTTRKDRPWTRNSLAVSWAPSPHRSPSQSPPAAAPVSALRRMRNARSGAHARLRRRRRFAETLPKPRDPISPRTLPSAPICSIPRCPAPSWCVTGYVYSTDCQPVANALLDFWHCDDAGVYDNTGYTLRGHQFTDAEGRYELTTIVPGLYTGRTRHIHVKAQEPDQPVLTSQLYFPDEPAKCHRRYLRSESGHGSRRRRKWRWQDRLLYLRAGVADEDRGDRRRRDGRGGDVAIDKHIVELTGASWPNALFIPTASSDSADYAADLFPHLRRHPWLQRQRSTC